MNYIIRKIKKNELPLLSDFLYEAIFVPTGITPPPKDVIEIPELQLYISNFGIYESDICYVAEVGKQIVGAVWVRIMRDYGNVDDETPSFAISLYKEYRGMGIGTALMKVMIQELTKRGYKQASLSVQKENYAVDMYKKIGFQIIEENDEEYIMIYHIS